MAILGQGIVPSGNIGNELTYLTRRGFIYRMIVQIYNSSPTIAALFANAQQTEGGLSPISVPVQGSAYTSPSFTDFSGTVPAPAQQQGSQLAQWNQKALFVPIGFLGLEGMIQDGAAIIRRLDAQMNDARMGAVDLLSKKLFGNSGATDTLSLVGFPGGIDDGTNAPTYGGLSHATYPWWNAKRYTESNAAPTRDLMLKYIVGTANNCGEVPSFGVTDPGTWHALATSFGSLERYTVGPAGAYNNGGTGAASAYFRSLEVAGVPIYMDPYLTPAGTCYFFNNRYGALYVNPKAAFSFTGFHSLIPNMQFGYVGFLITLLELVITKPKAFTVVTGLAPTSL